MIPAQLIKEKNKIIEPPEEVTIWSYDLGANKILIQHSDNRIEVHSFDEVTIVSNIKLSPIARVPDMRLV
jgi:hypothetical protein